MGKLLYTGTQYNTQGLISGYFRRYFSEFYDARGVLFRVEILDNVNSGATGFNFAKSNPQPFDLGRDGVTISWDGQADHLHESIVPSSLTMDFLLAGTYHKIFPEVLADSEEDRFLVAVFRFNPTSFSTTADLDGSFVPHWFGTLAAEGIEYVADENNEFLRLTAHDGLAALNDIPYQKANGDVYTTDVPLATHLFRVLEKLPTATLWSYTSATDDTTPAQVPDNTSSGPWIVQEIPHVGTQHVLEQVTNVPSAYSILSTHLAKASAFYEIETSEDQFGGTFATKTTSTCGQVLDAILQAFQLQIFQDHGSFWIMNWAALDGDTPLVHRFVDLEHLYTRAKNQIGHSLGNAYEFDLDANGFDALRGLSTRYLFPIQRSVSIHTKGGAKILLAGNFTHTPMGGQDPIPNSFSITDSSSPSHTTLQSSDAVVLGGDSPLMVGDVVVSTGRDLGALDEGLIGCKTLLNLTIKIGDYYLKRNVVQSSQGAVNIQRIGAGASGADLDYHDLVQDGAVEWTTTESTYTIVCPHVGMGDPEPDVVLQGDDNDIQRVAGFHIKIRNNGDEFKFRQVTGDTRDGINAEFSINWTLPALPDSVAEHVGAVFKCQAEYKSRLNATINPTAHDSIEDRNGLAGRIGNFRIYNTGDGAENDVTFVADHNKNRAIVKVSESILGDAYTGTDSIGALRHWNFSTSQWVRTGASGQKWGTTDDTDAALMLHELLALRGLQERTTFVPQVSGTFLFDPGQRSADAGTLTATANGLPALHQLIRYDVGVDGRKYFFQSATWTAKTTSFDFAGFIVDVDRNFSPNSTDDDQIAVPSGIGGGGFGPSDDHTNGGGLPGALNVVKGEALSGGTGTGLTSTQALKLAAITINAQNEISAFTTDATKGDILTTDQIDDASSTSNKFATPGQLSNISNNSGRLTTAEGDIDTLESQMLAVRRVLQDVNSGGGKGVYFTDSKLTSNAHLSVQDKRAILFAGSNTGMNIQETSPGTITLSVQAGPTSSEVQVTAMTITGSSSLQNATITFSQPVTFSSSTSGITSSQITEGSKLFHTNARVDARIAAASVTDLSDVTSVGSGAIITSSERVKLNAIDSGSGQIITTAERTKLAGIETGATNTTPLAGADQTLADNRTINTDGNDLTIEIGTGTTSFKNGSTAVLQLTDQGGVSFSPTGAVTIKGLQHPTSDGSAGQVLQTNGSGTLSFATPDSNLASANQVLTGTRTIFFDGNDLKFATGDGTGTTITELHYDADGAQGTGIFRFAARVEFQDIVNFRGAGGTSQSQIRFVEPPMGGSSAVVLKGPSTNLSSDVIFVLPDSDGSAGQFLKTDGSGNLSFASASGGGSTSYVLASSSTRVPMYYASRYYFGSSSYGWDTDTGYSTSQTGDTFVADDFAHMGIVAPTAISTLKIFATLRNDTSADDVSLYVYKGSRPNGSSSSISLTELIDIDIDVTQDRHHNADATATSAGISAGDLIFVSFKRAGSNGTKYVNASYTLHATE